MFRYEFFRRVGFDHDETPACFSYYTTDPINLVTSEDYFSDGRAEIKTGDWIFVNSNSRPFLISAISTTSARVDGEKIKVVENADDLPSPNNGVCTLEDNCTYHFTREVDLLGGRIVGGRNSAILGASSENCRIKSTGLAQGAALISSAWSMPIRHISLNAATILDLDASGNADQALDWDGVNFEGSTDIGTIANYNNFIGSTLAFLGVSGLVFDGTFGTVAINSTLLSADGGTLITIPATATITRRFRVNYSSVVTAADSTGINVSTSASIPVEGYILDTINFSGSGTPVAGVLFSDNKASWINCTGVRNSASIAGYFMQGNATTTTISAAETPTKAAGTTTAIGIVQRFTVATTNRATCDAAIQRDYKITAVFTATSGNGHQVGVYIAKNGTVLPESETYITTNASGRLENGALQVITDLVDTDYIELWVENNTSSTNITIEDLNLIIEALN